MNSPSCLDMSLESMRNILPKWNHMMSIKDSCKGHNSWFQYFGSNPRDMSPSNSSLCYS
jgi:hypothetical protein